MGIAAVVAVIAVVGVALFLNKPSSGPTAVANIITTPSTPNTPTTPRTNTPSTPAATAPAINYTTATYGASPVNATGNCQLYSHVVTGDFQCFGTAGNYSTLVTNEYHVNQSDKYYCKATPYGCRLYEKVYVQPF